MVLAEKSLPSGPSTGSGVRSMTPPVAFLMISRSASSRRGAGRRARGRVRPGEGPDASGGGGGGGIIPAPLVAALLAPPGGGEGGEPVGRRHEPVPGVAAGRDD